MSIVAVVSDLHVGSTTAIAPPTFRIHVRERTEMGVPVGLVPATCWDAAEQLCMLADQIGHSIEK